MKAVKSRTGDSNSLWPNRFCGQRHNRCARTYLQLQCTDIRCGWRRTYTEPEQDQFAVFAFIEHAHDSELPCVAYSYRFERKANTFAGTRRALRMLEHMTEAKCRRSGFKTESVSKQEHPVIRKPTGERR